MVESMEEEKTEVEGVQIEGESEVMKEGRGKNWSEEEGMKRREVGKTGRREKLR